MIFRHNLNFELSKFSFVVLSNKVSEKCFHLIWFETVKKRVKKFISTPLKQMVPWLTQILVTVSLLKIICERPIVFREYGMKELVKLKNSY
jgi:hypothetical protein